MCRDIAILSILSLDASTIRCRYICSDILPESEDKCSSTVNNVIRIESDINVFLRDKQFSILDEINNTNQHVCFVLS